MNCIRTFLLSLGFVPLLGISAPPASKAEQVDFVRDIRPILKLHCLSCHGSEKQKGGLRLDVKHLALAGGDDGKAILPGRSAESPLIRKVSADDPKMAMPPKGDRLTGSEIAKLRRWIDDGAAWPESTGNTARVESDHWAFQKIVRPSPPRKSGRPASAIDAFVDHRLATENLRRSPKADRYTLIRRLSLDLLGLPPNLEQVEQFVDDRDADAYGALVDRLLASEHYGERWGRHWLDLARYADSDGYEKDRARPYAYVFRDWVIKSVNDDLPFDQFSIQQLAGDLLPNATLRQREATGFHRQTLTNTEGGTDQEEFRCKNVVDRVSTTATVWLGVTMGCAECHSHKYDPFTQREFYQLFAFYNDASEKNIPSPRPAELEKYTTALKAWEATLKRERDVFAVWEREQLPARFAKWEKSTIGPTTEWATLKPLKVSSKNGATLKTEKENVVLSSGKNPGTDTYSVETALDLTTVTGVRLEVIDDPDPKKGPGRSKDGNFVLTRFAVVATLPDGSKRPLTLLNAKADFSQVRFPAAASLLGQTGTGWAVSPRKNETHVAVYEVKETAGLPPGTKLTFTLEHNYKTTYLLQRFRLAVTDSPGPFFPSLIGDDFSGILAKLPEQRTAAEKKRLLAYYRDEVDRDAAKLKKAIDTQTAKKPKYPPTLAAVLVAQAKGRETRIHKRGNFMDKGDQVMPLTPAVLHPLQARATKADRLDLAKWLFAADNPLTARVTVNHVWKNLFGRGLVNTVDDFGTRGDKPTHPELLDWLATEFRRVGWSRKALIKTIVMSGTYRQSSRVRKDLAERDPLNMLLARQSRMRLEAEVVRDSYLAASGLLSRKIGGPSVRPPLPKDIAALGYANSVRWTESKGADKYRRGLYIFFQRSVPYPMLMTFDAPDSTATCVRRERSNTPLQALTLLNDGVFFECAQALGRRIVAEAGSADVRAQLAYGFRCCVSRAPTTAELDRLMALHDRQLALARADLDGAAKAVGGKAENLQVAGQATMVALSRVILNLDEFITRD